MFKSKIISVNENSVSIIINDIYDGTISLSELTWLKKPPHPSKIININQETDVKILEIDSEKRKVFCSLKQLKENPWLKLKENYNINDSFETEIVNVVDFGIFVKVHDEIDGMVHISDLCWDEKKRPIVLEKLKKGDKIKVKILDINVDKERISLGIKQLSDDPVQDFLQKYPLKSKVTGKIINIDDKGIKVQITDNILGFIKKSNLSKDKAEQRTERFAIDESIDSMIISLDIKNRIINLSVKEIEIQDEKEALSKYGSSNSGASLGEILGTVLNKKN